MRIYQRPVLVVGRIYVFYFFLPESRGSIMERIVFNVFIYLLFFGRPLRI